MEPRRTYTHAPDDLAAIVLAQPDEGRLERIRSYDARSVLLLALVVAALAMVVAGLMTRGDDSPVTVPGSQTTSRVDSATVDAPPTGSGTGDAPANGAAGAAEATTVTGADATRQGAAATPAAAPNGIALEVGRITATPDAARGALVLRATVTNRGTDALVAGNGARLLVLVDDQVAGTATMGQLAAGGARATYSVSTYTCTPGRHVVTVIADATSRVRHATGVDVARSAELTITCP